MHVFHCNKRNIRSITWFTLLVLMIYVVINLSHVLSLPDVGNIWSRQGSSPHKQQVSVDIREINTDNEGNVQLLLNLNIKELLKMLDQDTSSTKAATGNPPPINVTLFHNNPTLCDNVPALKYVIYVHSSPGNHEKRKLLRSTWASNKLFKKQITALVFFMGRASDPKDEASLTQEIASYNDIIQGDFIDNYKNLTVKGIMAMKWVSTYCKQATFGIKADDDAFINIFQLLKVLAANEDKSKVMACPLWYDNSMPILRDPKKCAKWCVNFNEFPGGKYFPQYCAGLSFSISRNAISAMVKAAATTPFFWIDDVYVTGLLPPKIQGFEYVSLLQNFTVKQPIALAQYNNTKEPITYIFVHGKKPDISSAMWEWLLARLPPTDLELLSDEFAVKAKVFKDKLLR